MFVVAISFVGAEIAMNGYAYFNLGQTILLRQSKLIASSSSVQLDTRQKLSPIYDYNLRPGWVAAASTGTVQLGVLG